MPLTRAKPPIRKSPMKAARWRHVVQAGFLLVWFGPFGLRLLNVCGPVFHCYACPLATFGCPIGTMAQFSAMHLFPFAVVGTLLVAGGLLGGVVCGWICPFGFFQDLLAKIPTRKVRLPSWTGHFRYVVLVGAVIAVPFFFGKDSPLFICSICPAGATEASIPAMVGQARDGGWGAIVWPNALKLALLGLLVVAVFFKTRPWCTLLCPLGAIFGACNRFSAVYMKVHKSPCTSCGACQHMCRYGVRPAKYINDPLCIRCLDCTRCEAISLETVVGGGKEPEADSLTPGEQ